MIRVIDTHDLGLGETEEPMIGLEVPRDEDAEREMRATIGLCARKHPDRPGCWVIRKRHYRAVYRLLQRYWPGEEYECPEGVRVIDPAPGTTSSMGLSIPKPAWLRGRS